MFYLGLAYAVGDGLSINDDFAVRWIRAAAELEGTDHGSTNAWNEACPW